MKRNRYLALICIIFAPISAVLFVKWSSERNADPEWQRALKAVQDLDKNLPKNENEKHNLKAEDFFQTRKRSPYAKQLKKKTRLR